MARDADSGVPAAARPQGKVSDAIIAQAEDPGPKASGLPVLATVSLWFVTALVIGGSVMYGLGALATTSKRPWRNLTSAQYYDLSRSTVALTGLLGAAVAAGIATRRQRSHERAVEIANETQRISARSYALEQQRAERDVVRGLRDRYRDAAEQLGSAAPAVRLAGVFAMAALADDWSQRSDGEPDTQSCIDVLCAFLRTPPTAPELGEPGAPRPSLAGDREVRRTIVRVMASHLRGDSHATWSDHDFDLTGAVFDFDVDFSNCLFRGDVSFARGKFLSGTFNLDGARFEKHGLANTSAKPPDKNVTFKGATFATRVNLTSLTTERTMQFDGATFSSGKFTLRQLNLVSPAGLTVREATFSGCEVSMPELQVHPKSRVNFAKCEMMGGVLDLTNVIVHKGALLSIEDFKLRGGTFSFAESRVEGTLKFLALEQPPASGQLLLDELTVSGGSIQFSRSHLRGDRCSFTASRFDAGGKCVLTETLVDGQVTGPWPPGPMPERWPIDA